jgi:hypothetical protein
MKRALISALLASAAFATASAVFAQQGTSVDVSGSSANNGGLTRAQVKRELVAWREAGLVPVDEFNYPYDFDRLTASQRAALDRANPNSASPSRN